MNVPLTEKTDGGQQTPTGTAAFIGSGGPVRRQPSQQIGWDRDESPAPHDSVYNASQKDQRTDDDQRSENF